MTTTFIRSAESKNERKRMMRIAQRVDFNDYQRCNHVAACLKGGNILSIGTNKNTMPGMPWESDDNPCTEHAEVAAIRQLKSTKGVKLYVLRVRNNGSSALSKPCKACDQYIRKSGIKKVIYSDEGTFLSIS